MIDPMSGTQKTSDPGVFLPVDDMTLDISHELRTPLTAIQVTLDLLERGKLGTLSEQGRRMVRIAANNADRLVRLTTSLEQLPEFLLSPIFAKELMCLRLETDLRVAVKHRELQLDYQPIIHLSTGQIVGFEALLNWQHPTLGILFADQIMQVAEMSDLVHLIGAWMLWEACEQLRTWQKRYPGYFDSLCINVNLSSKQLFDPHLIQQVEQILQHTGLAAQSLNLEITENAMMGNTALVEIVLDQLRALGIQICLDDFGVGYSCLRCLHELPLDMLKVDRRFIDQLDSEGGKHLVQAIVSLARNIGIEVIAEGIETAEQLRKLQGLNCYLGQGYFFAKPLSAEAVIALICP
ncbi:MAG: EAL domain-containing protein [Cyanobacteria bacterium CRU_2_1]|nr:EAL domain-containing protein [Cyanobacteria bacterium CRU_2_1]